MRSELEHQRIMNMSARDQIMFLKSRLSIARKALENIIRMDQESSEEYSIASSAIREIDGTF